MCKCYLVSIIYNNRGKVKTKQREFLRIFAETQGFSGLQNLSIRGIIWKNTTDGGFDMNKLTKTLIFFLTILMLLNSLEVQAFSNESENKRFAEKTEEKVTKDETQGFDENEHGEVAKEGYCGGEYDAQYKLYEDGTAYIYGKMRSIKNCDDLRSLEVVRVYIEDGITELACSFDNFKYLKDIRIPENTKIKTDYTFTLCNSLENVTLPACVSEIGTEMFNKCTSLRKVNVSGTITKIGNRAFYECEKLENIDNLMTAESIGGMAFYGCNSLENIIIPENVKHMYERAFSNCFGLESVEIFGSVPNVTGTVGYWDGLEFSECGNLKQVILHEGAVGLRDTFYGCTSLEMIEIPNSVKRIDKNSFYACGKLTIRCYEGSYAETFAKKNNIPVDLIHVHKYESAITKEPTCAEKGIRTYTCSCGDEYTEEIDTIGHNYSGEVTKNATCTENGIKTFICLNCNDSYEEEIPATGHRIIEDVAVPATCEEEGKTEGSHCDICKEVIESQEIVPAIGHNYTGEVTEKENCESNGIKTYTCSNCHDSYKEIISATGHDYAKSETIESDCTKDGSEKYVCLKCGDSYIQTLQKTEHVYGEWEVYENPTIFKKGKKKITCTICGNVLQERDINKLKATVKISKTKLKLKKGKTYQLKIKRKSNGDKLSKWSTSNKKIVFVNEKTGKIKALKRGTAIITVKMKSGCKKTCKIIIR